MRKGVLKLIQSLGSNDLAAEQGTPQQAKGYLHSLVQPQTSCCKHSMQPLYTTCHISPNVRRVVSSKVNNWLETQKLAPCPPSQSHLTLLLLGVLQVHSPGSNGVTNTSSRCGGRWCLAGSWSEARTWAEVVIHVTMKWR